MIKEKRDELVQRLRNCGLKGSLEMQAADYIEELEKRYSSAAQQDAICQPVGYVEDYDLDRFTREGRPGDYLRMYAQAAPATRAFIPVYHAAPTCQGGVQQAEDNAQAFDAAIAGGRLVWDHKAGARAIAYEGFKAGRAAPVPVAAEDARDVLDPVEGDKLPPVGSKVLIHLARQDAWVEHTVTGYYAWGDLGGNPHLHRVFVRVKDADGYDNARLLSDVHPSAAMSSVTAIGGIGGEHAD